MSHVAGGKLMAAEKKHNDKFATEKSETIGSPEMRWQINADKRVANGVYRPTFGN